MEVSCDADQAYSEGCCELSNVVSHPMCLGSRSTLHEFTADLQPVLIDLFLYSAEDMLRLV